MATNKTIALMFDECSAVASKGTSKAERDTGIAEWQGYTPLQKITDRQLVQAVAAWKRTQSGQFVSMPTPAAIMHKVHGGTINTDARAVKAANCHCEANGFDTVDLASSNRLTLVEASLRHREQLAVRPCWRCNPEMFREWYRRVAGDEWSGNKPGWHDQEIKSLQQRIDAELASSAGLASAEDIRRIASAYRIKQQTTGEQ